MAHGPGGTREHAATTSSSTTSPPASPRTTSWRSVRRALPRKTKVGHAGTLDPFATGLLLVLVGRATRAQRFFMALPKRYEVVARFGAVSSTGDPEGEIAETGRVPDGELELPDRPIRQRPPAYSAVKVGGRRAYQLARAGAEVRARRARGHGVPLRAALARRRPPRRLSSSARRGRTSAASSPISATPTARSCGARGSGTSTSPTPTRERPVALVGGAGVPAGGGAGRRDGPAGRARGPRRRRRPAASAAGRRAVVRLTDDDGLIALAEPVDGGAALKPVVGFRG